MRTVLVKKEGIIVKSLFSNNFFSWENIKHFKLTGHEFLFLQPTRAISIVLKNGKKEVIFDQFYRNMPEFKRYLKKIAQLRKANQPIEIERIHVEKIEKTAIPVDYQNFKQYSGNPLFSIYGASLFACSILILYLFFYRNLHSFDDPSDYFLPMFLWLFIFILFGHQYHYFHINSHFLIVRHQFFFWKKKAFRLKDIKEISFEEPYRRNKGIRVITKDFESYLFLAGSLSEETWKELRIYLRRKKVRFV